MANFRKAAGSREIVKAASTRDLGRQAKAARRTEQEAARAKALDEIIADIRAETRNDGSLGDAYDAGRAAIHAYVNEYTDGYK